MKFKGVHLNPGEKLNLWTKYYNYPFKSGLYYYLSLFRNKRFALNEMFQRNTSKFAIFYV